MSSLIGMSGRVLVVEPHEANTAALTEYIVANEVKNVTIAPAAAWNGNGKLVLNTFPDSGANTLDAIHGPRGTSQVEVPAATIDALATRFLDGPVDFVNLTINGAEPEAVEGMSQLMERYPAMDIPVALRHQHDNHIYARRRPLVELLMRRGYAACIADAHIRPWTEAHGYTVVMTRRDETELAAMGFRKANREERDHLLPPA